MTPKETCRYCTTMLYSKVERLFGDYTYQETIVDKDGLEHTVARCRDTASNRMKQLEYGRGASHCGYQWGMGARNHGGGCEQAFADAEEVFRCLDCGGTFHKACLRKHFAEHSGATPEAARDGIAAYFEHLSTVEVGAIDLTGMPARELYAMVASWIRNRVDARWAEETAKAKEAEPR